MGEIGERVLDPGTSERTAAGRDLPAMDEVWSLVCDHLDLVRGIARRYRGSRLAPEDLRAEGVLGLVEAALRFNPSLGVRFATYASWWVRKAMRDAVEREASLVPVSKYRLDQIGRIRTAQRDLRHELRRSPRFVEVAERAGVETTAAADALASVPRVVSLEDPTSPGNQIRFGDTIVEEREPSPDAAIVRETVIGRLRQGLASLPMRERDVLRHHFGLEGVEAKPLSTIAADYGLSRERIHQIERAAIRRLRRSFAPRRREAEA